MLPTLQTSQMFHAALLKSSQVGSYLWFGAELSSFTSFTSSIRFFTDVISSEKSPQTLAAVFAWSSRVEMVMLAVVRKATGSRVYGLYHGQHVYPSPVRALNSVSWAEHRLFC